MVKRLKGIALEEERKAWEAEEERVKGGVMKKKKKWGNPVFAGGSLVLLIKARGCEGI